MSARLIVAWDSLAFLSRKNMKSLGIRPQINPQKILLKSLISFKYDEDGYPTDRATTVTLDMKKTRCNGKLREEFA